MTLNKLPRRLYRGARVSRDANSVLSGKPGRVVRRAKNHVVGRALARAGFWPRLWG